MNQLVVAAPSDTTPPTRIIPGGSYGFLTFDFTMVLPAGAVLTSANLTISNGSFIASPSKSIQASVVKFLILTTMADGDVCTCSCTVGTSIGSGDARSIRLVAYDSGVTSAQAPVIPMWLTNTVSITPGEINDGATLTLTIPVLNATSGSPAIVAPDDDTPLIANVFVSSAWVSAPGTVSFILENQSGDNRTIGATNFTATVAIVS